MPDLGPSPSPGPGASDLPVALGSLQRRGYGEVPQAPEASLLPFSMGISPARLMGAPRPLQPPFLGSPAGLPSLGSGVEPGGWSWRGDTGLGGQQGAGAWFSRAVRLDSQFLSVTQEQLEAGHHGSTDTQQSPAKGPGGLAV